MIAKVASRGLIVSQRVGVSFRVCKNLKRFSGLTLKAVTVNLA